MAKIKKITRGSPSALFHDKKQNVSVKRIIFTNFRLSTKQSFMTQLEIKTAIQIHKPIAEVFEAIIDPAKMSNYFISESTGKMAEGETLTWEFPEFDERFPIDVIKVESPELIVFEWEGTPGKKLRVDIKLESRTQNDTLVRITEGKMDSSMEGIEWLGRNTEGWANFLASMKAYLEHGINLRKGAFDFMKKS